MSLTFVIVEPNTIDRRYRLCGCALYLRNLSADFIRRTCRLVGQRFHLCRDDGKALAGLAGTRRFEGPHNAQSILQPQN